MQGHLNYAGQQTDRMTWMDLLLLEDKRDKRNEKKDEDEEGVRD